MLASKILPTTCFIGAKSRPQIRASSHPHLKFSTFTPANALITSTPVLVRLNPSLTRRQTTTCARAKAAAKAAVLILPAGVSLELMTYIFAASTIYAASLALLMAALPRWQGTRRLVSNPLCIVPVALAYGMLLYWSWQPDTFSLILPGSWAEGFKGGFNPQFFPSLSGIVTLFSRVPTAASLWVHLLAVDLFAARHIYLEGMQYGTPTWHSILLCMTVAPLGLLSHHLTKASY